MLSDVKNIEILLSDVRDGLLISIVIFLKS